MTKEEIKEMLESHHLLLFNWLEEHDEDSWEKGPEGKWTTGQQVYHLVQSLQALNKAMRIPKFVLKWSIGSGRLLEN